MDFKPTIGIYALADPDSRRVMYVGQSVDIDYRYRQHCDYYLNDRSLRKSSWIDDLRRAGKKPHLHVLETLDSEFRLDDAERKWIRHFKAHGEAELNIASGGRSLAASAVQNAAREEWFQFAHKVREAHRLLTEVRNAAGRMASAKHCDAFLKLARRFDKEIERIENRVLVEFPKWTDVAMALKRGRADE